MKQSMNLSFFNTKKLATDGVPFHLSLMSGEKAYMNGKPIIIKLLGSDSTVYRSYNAAIKKKLKENQRDKNQIGFDDEEAHSLNLDLYSACTVGWENIVDEEENPVPFSHATARKMYDDYPVIFEQIIRFVETRKNFLLASGVALSSTSGIAPTSLSDQTSDATNAESQSEQETESAEVKTTSK